MLAKEARQAEERATRMGPTQKERERLDAAVSALEEQHASKSKKAEMLRAKVDEVKAALVDAGSARLAAVRSRVGLVESKIKEVRINSTVKLFNSYRIHCFQVYIFALFFSPQTNNLFTKLEVDIKSAHRNKAKCEAKVKAYEEEVESLKTKLTAIEARMVEIEKTAKICMDEFQELQKMVSGKNVKRGSLLAALRT